MTLQGKFEIDDWEYTSAILSCRYQKEAVDMGNNLKFGQVDVFLLWCYIYILQALAEDCKEIISKLSKLRHMMQTDKKLTLIEDSDEDAEIWNRAIKAARSLVDGSAISWFSGAWLTCECYMYRKVYEAISLR